MRILTHLFPTFIQTIPTQELTTRYLFYNGWDEVSREPADAPPSPSDNDIYSDYDEEDDEDDEKEDDDDE
jgi:hypothetical protein